ncbi:MAG: NAD(P)H-quinone oxidoreductase subunit 3 [bacterium]|nr:NAD(P)H-quinone oxidoreductase subunit 3 [bacterium]
MPSSFAEQYFPILLQILIATAVAGGMIGASLVLGKRLRNRVKDSPYECGMTPVGSARERFSVKFYLVAMIFILFDVEVVFLYPWAVVYSDLKLYGFIVMFSFLQLVLWGFFYIWKKGVLDWSEETGSSTST